MSAMFVSPPVSLFLSWLPFAEGARSFLATHRRTSTLVQGGASGPHSCHSLCFSAAEATHSRSLSSAALPLLTVAPGYGKAALRFWCESTQPLVLSVTPLPLWGGGAGSGATSRVPAPQPSGPTHPVPRSQGCMEPQSPQ